MKTKLYSFCTTCLMTILFAFNASAQANRHLDNLLTTDINLSLIPQTDNSIDLGTSSFQWSNLYLGGSVYLDGLKFIDNSGSCTFIGATGNTTNTGINNTFVGYNAGNANTSGGYNTFVGHRSGIVNTTGYANAFFGNASGFANTTGYYNTFIGQGAGLSNTTGYYNAFCGTNAGGDNTTGNHNSFFGNSAGVQNLTGNNNAFFGESSGGATTSSDNSFFGTSCGGNNTTGSENTFMGYSSGYSNTTGGSNVTEGSNSLYSNTTGNYNVALGEEALYNNTTGDHSTGIGYKALYSGTTTSYNTAVGYYALYSNTGGDNSAFGNQALQNSTSAYDNTGMGYIALGLCSTGNYNTAVGSTCMNNNTTGSDNTAVGYTALNANSTGTKNTCIGSQADVSGTNLNNATAIGYGTTVISSNTMRFGNASVTFWGFGANPAFNKALIVGSSASNGNGAYLTTGGAWTNGSARWKKEDFQKQDPQAILDKINLMEVTKWKYKGTKDEYHYGPMADDFHRLFGVADDSSISDLDKTGVLFLGVQALSAEGKELNSKVLKMEFSNDSLKAVNQELQAQLNTVIDRLNTMEQSLSQCCMNYQSQSSNPNTNHSDIARLEQNIPNPFDAITVIKFYLPAATKNAQLIISDIAGHVIKQFNLDQLGFNQVTIPGGELASGSYTYSLIIDGRKVDSKKMELTK